MRDFTIDLVWAKVQMAFTAIGGWLGYFLGGVDGLLITLVVFMALDYITGVMCGIVDKKLSSAVGFKGLFRKMLIIALVGVGHVVDISVVGTGGALRSAVICFYLSNEGLSMIENATRLGLPVPDKLKEILAQLHNKNPAADGNDNGDSV
ncbi:MAG: phage holin family protein [Candidatus Limiplasma sp.]|nr:phage holin family protein [Candidatus Limiplasma sp.]